MDGRKGVSPIIATTVLVLVVLGMAVGAYTFVSQGQETVEEKTQRVELETINTTCLPDRLTWWVNNTGENAADTSIADIFVYDDEGLNSTLSAVGVPVSGFTRAFGSGRVEVTPSKRMALGERYSLELEVGNTGISSSCRAGGEWWDANWDYRRALELDTSSDVTAELVVDVDGMVDEGKLREDCADFRGVKNREVIPYEVTFCNPDGTASVQMNLSGTEPGETYLYYGNLQAGSAEKPLVNEGIVNPDLGPEERVNLP